MTIIAYTALHYGRGYLAYAIRSVINHIQELHVLYSPVGSHGHQTNIPCPETREELYTIAAYAAGDKLRWHDGQWAHEGLQRDSIYQYAPDADVILVLDADEIWNDVSLNLLLASTRHWGKRYIRLPMVHFWRSFYRAIIHDPAYPIRVIYPHETDGERTWDTHPIAHMGYAQRPEIVEYKQLTHGHKNEWRTDIDWFQERFMANAQEDCHPVGSEYWNPEYVEPLDYMPSWMALHPYYMKEVIE